VDRARSFGPATVTVIEQILNRQAIEAQGYLDCQNTLDGLGGKKPGTPGGHLPGADQPARLCDP